VKTYLHQQEVVSMARPLADGLEEDCAPFDEYFIYHEKHRVVVYTAYSWCIGPGSVVKRHYKDLHRE
jgi:hypothetical protein